MKWNAIGIAALAAAGVFGCSSEDDVDIGSDGSQPAKNLGSKLSDYAGSWEGHVEAYTFTDGTDRVRLSLSAQGAGSLELGNDAPPLPAPDPTQAPPGWTAFGPSASPEGVLLGYPHVTNGVSVDANRLKFQTAPPKEWETWCELLQPVPADDQSYYCLPNVSYLYDSGSDTCRAHPDSGPDTIVPCGPIVCLSECNCDANICKLTQSAWKPLEFDSVLENDGGSLVGTLVVNFSSVTVRLSRSAP